MTPVDLPPADPEAVQAEPTPIWDQLIAQRGVALVLAADDVVDAMVAGLDLVPS